MTIAIGGHLLLVSASIAAGAVATMLGLVLVRLAQQAAGARALRTLALVVRHQLMVADSWSQTPNPRHATKRAARIGVPLSLRRQNATSVF
jgi:hypothetical protein